MATKAKALAHGWGPRRMADTARQRVRASGRTRAAALLLRASPRSAIWLALWTIVTGLLPVITIVTMGVTVGRVPAAARDGLGSPAGHALIEALVATSAVFLFMLAIAPVKEFLSASLKVRLTYVMQQRLAAAVSAPTGIEHLEDPVVLDRLALAQGSLMSYYPADAPVLLAGLIANQLTGISACVVIGWFRWWLGLLVLSLWITARRPLRRDLMNVVRSFGGESDVMRRSEYFRLLAMRPPAAKEVRVFGLEDWVVDSFRTHWLEGMTKVWKLMNRLTATMARVSVLVVIVYGLACFVIARAVLDHNIGIGMVATLLPLLMSAALAGTLTPDQVALEFTAGALPHLDEMEHELSPAGQASDSRTANVRYRASRGTDPFRPRGVPVSGREQPRLPRPRARIPGRDLDRNRRSQRRREDHPCEASRGPPHTQPRGNSDRWHATACVRPCRVATQCRRRVPGLHPLPVERGRQRDVRVDRALPRHRSPRRRSKAGGGTRDHRTTSQRVGHGPVA